MTKWQIEAPVRSFTGSVAEVPFQNGTGYVEDDTKQGRAALEYFRRQHYGVAVAPEKPLAQMVMDLVTGTADKAPGGPFDPSTAGVDAVLAYLDTADADEALRVLDAEAAGSKNRAGIVSKREAILAAKTPTTPAPAEDPKGPQA